MIKLVKGLSILAFGFLVGCGDKGIVESGVMSSHKSITVGDAFNNWDSCEKTKWEEFKTDSNMRVVEFSCMDIIKPAVMEELTEKFITDQTPQNRKLGIAYFKYVFQWIVNQDESFDIDNVELVILWRDGKKYRSQLDANEQVALVYQNYVFTGNEYLDAEKISSGLGKTRFQFLWATLKDLRQKAE